MVLGQGQVFFVHRRQEWGRAHLCAGALFLWIATLATVDSARADIGPFIVFDAASGQVLAERNAHQRWYPASITKLMTAYLAFEAIDAGQLSLQSPVVVSANAATEPPSKIGLPVGKAITLESALAMMLVKSANDISVAVAETVAGSEAEFVRRMNETARRLGMTQTRFVNPHGLPDNDQVSTARDLGLLARAVVTTHRRYAAFFTYTHVRVGDKTLRSANREYLLRVPGASGLKTGYICNSGFNVAASAHRGGRTLIVVVLGAASAIERAAFVRRALDEGFKTRRAVGRLEDPLRAAFPGNPPPDGHCRRNRKPNQAELMARFGPAAPALAYDGGRQNALGVALADLAEPADGVVPASAASNWATTINAILGPRIGDNRVVRASLAPPPGYVAPAKPAASSGRTASAAASRLPASKPLDLRPPALR